LFLISAQDGVMYPCELQSIRMQLDREFVYGKTL